MEHNNNNPKDEIDKLLYDYFKTHDEDVPIETSKAIDEALYKKKKHSSFNISKIAAIILLCFTMTTGLIFAKDIINFFSEIFDLKSTNIDNSGIVDAIANKNYIQNVDMDYIPIDDNYSIKVDYLMLDDLNLYLVFNLHSNKKIDENYRISITDLKLTDQDGNVIYDGNNFNFYNNKSMLFCDGWNKINTNQKNTIKELVYILSNNFTNITKIKLSFSNIILYNDKKPSNNILLQTTNKINYELPIDSKFNKNYMIKYEIEYIRNPNFTIEKCISTNNGLYICYKSSTFNTNFEINNYHNISKDTRYLGIGYDNKYYFITYFNINNINTINITDINTNFNITLRKSTSN